RPALRGASTAACDARRRATAVCNRRRRRGTVHADGRRQLRSARLVGRLGLGLSLARRTGRLRPDRSPGGASVMPSTIFIDGAAGTTGLEIADRLAGRSEFALLTLDDARRKDPAARREAL